MTKFKCEDYWRWPHSDLISNAERGIVAEYIVGRATKSLGLNRVEWDAWDLTTPDGVKIEVKASGYVQSWEQEKPSTIRFTIGEANGWSATTNTCDDVPQRSADVYVFCIHTEFDKETADPLDTTRWEFVVLPTSVLNQRLGCQKTVGVSTLIKLGGKKYKYESLQEAISVAGT